MKFGPLIEYNLRNTTCGGETICRPKNQNRAYLWINILKLYIYIFCFDFSASRGTSLPASFSAWFLNKNVSPHIFIYLTKSQYLVAFTSWDIGQYVYCNSLLTRLWRCDVINFEINLIFLIKTFFLHDQKVNTKI